jgi:hypothetical protein
VAAGASRTVAVLAKVHSLRFSKSALLRAGG